MAGSVNKVILIGNAGRDPEVRSFQNGGKVCTLRLATSETWKDKTTGERKERTEWHTVSIMSEPLVKVAESYIKKGAKVYIEGQLETRKWQDQSGADRYSTEVVLRPYNGVLTLLDSAGGNGGGARDDGAGHGQQGSVYRRGQRFDGAQHVHQVSHGCRGHALARGPLAHRGDRGAQVSCQAVNR